MSPRGFEGVRQHSADIEAKRGQGGPGALWFRIRAGDETVVRFLEQDDDIFWAHVHEVPVEGRSWGKPVVCLDQERNGTPCPGCERELPRKFQGYINVIWDDAPVFKRDSDGKLVRDRLGDPVIVDNKAQVAVWSSGIRLFEELDEINANFRGLMSRRFRIKRRGEKLDTKYSIAPEDVDSGPQPLTEAEKKLADEKFDLSQYTKPGSYEEFMKELGEDDGQSNGNAQVQSRNPFLRNK